MNTDVVNAPSLSTHEVKLGDKIRDGFAHNGTYIKLTKSSSSAVVKCSTYEGDEFELVVGRGVTTSRRFTRVYFYVDDKNGADIEYVIGDGNVQDQQLVGEVALDGNTLNFLSNRIDGNTGLITAKLEELKPASALKAFRLSGVYEFGDHSIKTFIIGADMACRLNNLQISAFNEDPGPNFKHMVVTLWAYHLSDASTALPSQYVTPTPQYSMACDTENAADQYKIFIDQFTANLSSISQSNITQVYRRKILGKDNHVDLELRNPINFGHELGATGTPYLFVLQVEHLFASTGSMQVAVHADIEKV